MSEPSFKRIGLVGKTANNPGLSDLVAHLCDFLLAKGIQVSIDQAMGYHGSIAGVEILPRTTMGAQSDLTIVLGGDGTLLNAARSLAQYNVPLVGVNMGRLGFLTDISPQYVTEKLSAILDGQFQEEERLMLRATVVRDGVPISEGLAFNDVVVHKWEEARMLEFEVGIDDYFVNTQRADGLIIATPTGSTAYALSGGGPILHPTLDAIVLVPICPHTLSLRPLVVASTSQVCITISEFGHASAQVTCDGHISLGVEASDTIVIKSYEHKVKLIHPTDYNYYDVLRAKLHWGEKL
ncbi:MAG: NAD(+) kinase [Pseudomonadota bacterium]